MPRDQVPVFRKSSVSGEHYLANPVERKNKKTANKSIAANERVFSARTGECVGLWRDEEERRRSGQVSQPSSGISASSSTVASANK